MQQQHRNNDLYKFPGEHGKGIIATVLFHVALAVLLILTGFHTKLPLPEEDGILVNFGYDETGSGLLEPAPQSSSEEAYVPDQDIPSDVENDIPAASTDPVMTQEFEEAPEVVKTVVQPDPEELRRQREAAEAERLRLKQLEEERIKREAEEAERKRIEEEQERLKREAEERQRQLDNIRNQTRNALANSNASGSNTGANEGISGGEGNQGVVTGAENAKIYGEGSGTGTKGVSFDLAGRQVRSLPPPSYDIQSEGIVVVEITVDRSGNVTQAVPGVKGSTTLEEYFLKVAKEAALQARFDAKPDATIIQKGTITYHFILR